MENPPEIAILVEGRASYLSELEAVLGRAGIDAALVKPPDSKPGS